MSFRQGWALFIGLGVAGGCLADPEIMVHEGDLAERGELVATLHGNYTPKGDRRRDDGTWPTYRLTSLMAEFATGLAPGWEAGIHLPFMRAGIDSDTSQRGDWGASAVMFRLKYIRRQDSGVFYGFNAEYDINAKRYVADPRSIEFRGIVGFDAEHFRVTANPHLIWGFGRSGGIAHRSSTSTGRRCTRWVPILPGVPSCTLTGARPGICTPARVTARCIW